MASIVSLAHAPAVARPACCELLRSAERHEVWCGASGRGYAHRVYNLIECPPLPRCVYVLVRRADDGSATALHIGLGLDDAETVNLARVRQRGAQLGANEVHVHVAASSEAARALAALDLRASQFGQLGPEQNAAATGVPHTAA